MQNRNVKLKASQMHAFQKNNRKKKSIQYLIHSQSESQKLFMYG